MSSKSPVRSCEDVDETALSYSEIKALCAGDPRIAEKMNLDNEVAKLRMLKAEHRSQHYRLEDDLLTNFPKRIAAISETIAGIETDIAMYAAEKEKCVEIQTSELGGASVSQKFPGMTIGGVTYTEKEPAAKALLDACKGVKGSKIDLPVGEYMGFKLSLHYESYGQQINLLMRGAMTYQLDIGTDALGNLTRISHSLDKLSERLEGQRAQLAELNRQAEAAKTELEKPFTQEDELAEKEKRLALLNADLNIDGNGEMDVLNDADIRANTGDSTDEPDADDYGDGEPEDDCLYAGERVGQAVSAKAKPSILEGIRDFDSSKYNGARGRDVKPAERGI
jgi:hypothetical protein